MYFVKTPQWLKKLYSGYFWDIPSDGKVLYLTFDDGPHERATPFVLNELKKYNARATFFCLGKNVVAEPALYQRILNEGHAVGNHTHNHLNGWKTEDKLYIENVMEAAKYIDACLFRPPYGRITRFQAGALKNTNVYNNIGYNIIMWDVLSGDFDNKISPEECLLNVVKHSISGSIIVFHDSEKAFFNLNYTLPKILNYFSEKGYRFDPINIKLLKKLGPE